MFLNTSSPMLTLDGKNATHPGVVVMWGGKEQTWLWFKLILDDQGRSVKWEDLLHSQGLLILLGTLHWQDVRA